MTRIMTLSAALLAFAFVPQLDVNRQAHADDWDDYWEDRADYYEDAYDRDWDDRDYRYGYRGNSHPYGYSSYYRGSYTFPNYRNSYYRGGYSSGYRGGYTSGYRGGYSGCAPVVRDPCCCCW